MRAALLLAALALPVGAQTGAGARPDATSRILPLREQAAWRDAVTRERLDTIVPALMRREGIDAWVIVAREYDEDPVLSTMLPATWLSARRRTILVFLDGRPTDADERPGDADDGPGDAEEGAPGRGEVRRLAVARYPVGDLFPGAWDPEEEPDQLARLAAILREHDPARIAVDVSPTFALADGLSKSEHDGLVAALGEELAPRLVSGERLAIGWLETRTETELAVYPKLCRIAHQLIAEGFSADGVRPGFTSTRDLEWWFRERIRALGLTTWFHPSVSLQRPRGADASGSFADEAEDRVIQRGDLLHVDVGITYLGLQTDTQQHAYVLREGEETAPPGLLAAFATGNRMQDLLTAQLATGRTGNEILRLALAAAAEAGIRGTVYSHPLGYHGHGAGPLIGLWDQQEGVPGRGDYPLFPSTVFSIELNVAVPVPEWGGQEVLVMLEEDAAFDGEIVRYLDGRQTAPILIR